jgi:hypothetical protein
LQESEGEDAETSRVVLEAPAAGRAGRALVGRQSRVRLHEVGPRLEMEIVKVGGNWWKLDATDRAVMACECTGQRFV